jgi:hypothetical protein
MAFCAAKKNIKKKHQKKTKNAGLQKPAGPLRDHHQVSHLCNNIGKKNVCATKLGDTFCFSLKW